MASDDDGPSHRVEWRASNPLGEVSHVSRVHGTFRTPLEVRCEHALLELRELAVELERHLLSNSCAHDLRIDRAHGA